MKTDEAVRPTTTEMACPHCGHVGNHPVRQSGPHAAADCAKCGKFIKNVSKGKVIYPPVPDAETLEREFEHLVGSLKPCDPDRDLLAGHVLGWDPDATDAEIEKAYRFVDRMRKIGGDC